MPPRWTVSAGVHAAFNVAGGSRPGYIVDLAETDWDFTVDLCLKGVFLGMKHQARQMMRQGNGVIVNIASLNAHVPMHAGSAYVAAKAGVEMLSRNGALEFAEFGMRVNAILPGSGADQSDSPPFRQSRRLGGLRAAHPDGPPSPARGNRRTRALSRQRRRELCQRRQPAGRWRLGRQRLPGHETLPRPHRLEPKDSAMTIRIRRGHDGAVATVSINNAARLNCLGQAQITAFIDAVTTLADDPDLRVLIVTGEGDRAFMGAPICTNWAL